VVTHLYWSKEFKPPSTPSQINFLFFMP
jgi:hypothetical protein